MAPPTQKDVEHDVRMYVASFAQLTLGQVQPPMKLRGLPINLDDNQLVFLATTLRGYVRNHNASATLRAADTRKDGQTVGGLGTVVHARITGKGK